MDDWRSLDDLEKIGDKIQDIIEAAIDTKNYQKLNQTITQAVNNTINQYQDSRKEREEPKRYASRRTACTPGSRSASERTDRVPAGSSGRVLEPWEARPELYKSLTGQKVKHILWTVFGGILTGGMVVGFLTLTVFQLLLGSSNLIPSAIMLLGAGAGSSMLASGCKGLARIGRFRKYVKALGTNTYCNFDQMSRITGKSVKYIRKDIKGMIRKGWFLEGHVDQQETCLITANETFRLYEESQKQLEMKKVQEEERKTMQSKRDPQVQEVLEKGSGYLKKIRESNAAIPGVEISAKISRMEQIVERIFDRAESHPEIIPDLKRLMDYYLPMTVKLLDAYGDMDCQPVQGENIRSSKAEIEKTLDTLNDAFARLLDSIFQDTAWDVSSDISVLHTMLAQEGLTGSDFDLES